MWDQKTVSFEGFPKFWREPNLREWWVGVKILSKRMAMQSNCNWLVDEVREPKRIMRSAGAARGEDSKFEASFFSRAKMCG